MKIIVDTSRDGVEDIQKAIKVLSVLVEEGSDTEEASQPSGMDAMGEGKNVMGNIFDTPDEKKHEAQNLPKKGKFDEDIEIIPY
jgi:hypothetical protein